MCISVVWHEFDQGDRKCTPDKERRVLVAQDDGYIEMAYWNGESFEHDWPIAIVGSREVWNTHHLPSRVPRVRYWCDLPEIPTEDGEAPY